MKNITYILLCVSLLQACNKECCFDGDQITEAEAIDILNQNESGDTISNGNVTGHLECLNGSSINGLSIQIKDSTNTIINQSSANMGAFNFPILESGRYTLLFTNLNQPSYSITQWNNIVSRVQEITLGGQPATNIEKLAFNIINYNDGITTLDLIIFRKLRDGTMDISEIEYPWRYVITSQINVATNISDSLTISLDKTQKINLDITPIYFGDTNGQICN